MSARHTDQPFSRGSTIGTVALVILVVGTIAVGVAYFANREWGSSEELASLSDDELDQASRSDQSKSPAGDSRPQGPQVNELFKSPVDDPWPSLPVGADSRPVDEGFTPVEQPAKGEPAALPRPDLSQDGSLSTGSRDDAEVDRSESSGKVASPELPLKGPLLGNPQAEVKQLPSKNVAADSNAANPSQANELAEQLQGAGQAAEAAAFAWQETEQSSPLTPQQWTDLVDLPQPEDEDSQTAVSPEKPTVEADTVPNEVAKVTPDEGNYDNQPRETLSQAAQTAGTFGTFLKLIEAADLNAVLDGEQFFTLIAPTDKAFEALPRGTVNALQRPEHREKLESLLAFHLIPGNYSASALANRRYIATVNGQRLKLDVNGVQLKINDASLAMPSIACRNGVLHGVDQVLLPVADNVAGVLDVEGDFSILKQLLEQAELQDAFTGDQALTLFAPTNKAFEALPTDLFTELVQPENKQLLKAVLLHHMAEGRVYSHDLLSGDAPRSLEGSTLETPARAVRVGDAESLIAQSDLEATNGVVHKVNRVMMPPKVEMTLLKPIDETAQSPQQSVHERWRRMLEQTVSDGKSHYSNGNHAACVDLYEQAIRQLLQSTDESEVVEARQALLTALTEADRQESSTAQAWVLRRGINEAYAVLSRSNSRTGN